MRRACMLAAVALLLGGCASMEERASQECVELGMQPGTADFAKCYQMSMQRRQSAINAAIQAD